MAIQRHSDAEVVGRLHHRTDGGAHFVAQGQRLGLDIEIAVLLAGGKGGYGQVAVDDGKRGPVFKVLPRAPLNAYHLWSENGETGPSRGYNSLGTGLRIDGCLVCRQLHKGGCQQR